MKIKEKNIQHNNRHWQTRILTIIRSVLIYLAKNEKSLNGK